MLPCDLVCELGADKLLQAWMVKSASLEDLLGDSESSHGARSGGLGVWYQTKTPTPIKGEETDFIATVPLPSSSVLPAKGSLFPDMAKLVYSTPTDSLKDLIEEKKGFPTRHALLRQHPRVRMLTTHRDAHIYIFPHWVMQFIAENERLETIGEDVIGWWAKAGWQKGLSTKLGLDNVLRRPGNDNDSGQASPRESTPRKLTLDSTAADEPNTVVSVKSNNNKNSHEPHSPQSSSTAIKSTDTESPVPPMLAYIHPYQPTETAPLIRRVDTAQLLLQISLQLAKLPSLEDILLEGGTTTPSPFAHTRKVAYPEGVKPRTTITRADSLVADNVTVSEKSSIKECVVGANCQIGEGAKLIGCLLMDGVVVGKNCKLTKCILGRRSEIGEGCVLTDCEVQENLLVESKSEFLFFFYFYLWPFHSFLSCWLQCSFRGTNGGDGFSRGTYANDSFVLQLRPRTKSSCPHPAWRQPSRS